MLFGASGVFGQLQDALNTIWGVEPKPGRAVWTFLHDRFLSYGGPPIPLVRAQMMGGAPQAVF